MNDDNRTMCVSTLKMQIGIQNKPSLWSPGASPLEAFFVLVCKYAETACLWLVFRFQHSTDSLFLELKIFLDFRFWPEGSYKLGSIHLSVHPSVWPSFCLQVFSELAHQFFLKLSMYGVMGPYNHVLSFVWNLCKTKVLMVH